MLGDFYMFCRLKIISFQKFFQEFQHSVNSLDPDQACHLVRPDLGANCLQRLSADDISTQLKKAFLFDLIIYVPSTIFQL